MKWGITATTVRVPVYRSHSESVNIELEKEVSLEAMREALSKFPGVILQDDPQNQIYPMPLYTSDKNDVYVGRLRKDESAPRSYNFWCVGDQIRKGAALNTMQIAEVMIKTVGYNAPAVNSLNKHKLRRTILNENNRSKVWRYFRSLSRS